MTSLRVQVSGSVLEGAIRRSGQTVDQLAEKNGLRKLPEWIDESLKPTLRQLETLAQATITPLGYLLLDTQIEDPLPIPHFRIRDPITPASTDPDLLETVQTLEKRQDWLRDYLIDKGQDPIRAVGSASLSDTPLAVAALLHEFLGTRPGWTSAQPSWEKSLSTFKEAIEHGGVYLVVNGVVGNNSRRSLEGKPFSGFSLIDEYAPFIFLNNTEAKTAQMFTLAHEMAHILYGSSAACDFEQLYAADHHVERACDRTAAEYLLPSDTLASAWPSEGTINDSTLELARRYKVSQIVVARRARDLRLVDEDAYAEFYSEYRRYARPASSSDDGGGNYYYNQNSRVGQAFARHVVAAVESGELLYRDAYSLTDMYGSTFDNYANYVKGLGLP